MYTRKAGELGESVVTRLGTARRGRKARCVQLPAGMWRVCLMLAHGTFSSERCHPNYEQTEYPSSVGSLVRVHGEEL